jgi:hypothetical protein
MVEEKLQGHKKQGRKQDTMTNNQETNKKTIRIIKLIR